MIYWWVSCQVPGALGCGRRCARNTACTWRPALTAAYIRGTRPRCSGESPPRNAGVGGRYAQPIALSCCLGFGASTVERRRCVPSARSSACRPARRWPSPRGPGRYRATIVERATPADARHRSEACGKASRTQLKQRDICRTCHRAEASARCARCGMMKHDVSKDTGLCARCTKTAARPQSICTNVLGSGSSTTSTIASVSLATVCCCARPAPS